MSTTVENLQINTPYYLGNYSLYVLNHERVLVNENPYVFLAYGNIIEDEVVIESFQDEFFKENPLETQFQLMKIKISTLEDIFNENIEYYVPNYDAYLEMYYSFQEKKLKGIIELESSFNDKIENILKTKFFQLTKAESSMKEYLKDETDS